MAFAEQVKIRKGVAAKIIADLGTYAIPEIAVEETYFPNEKLESIGDTPFIKVVCIAPADARSRELRNVAVSTLRLGVQIAVQQKVNPTKTDEIDTLILVSEQVMDSLRDDELVTGENFNWSETQPLLDENGLVFSYEQLVVQNVFNVVFTVFFTYIKQ